MKKFLLALMILAVCGAGFLACSRENVEPLTPEEMEAIQDVDLNSVYDTDQTPPDTGSVIR